MKVGDIFTVRSGRLKGVEVQVHRIRGANLVVHVQRDHESDNDYFEEGEEYTIPLPKSEKQILDAEIASLATQLRGALLKRKNLENPASTEREIKKLLECVKL